MPNPLKPRVRQTINFPFNPDKVLAIIKANLGADWQIQSEQLRPDSISFLATREGVEIDGIVERWQGTESRVQLDGKVTLLTPYEDWRDWSGATSFLALFAIWILVSYLPLTATTFLQLTLLSFSNGLLVMLFMTLILAYFLGIPFLIQRYFTQLSPDIKAYGETQAHLANFVSQVKALSALHPDTSRLEEADETPYLAEAEIQVHQKSKEI